MATLASPLRAGPCLGADRLTFFYRAPVSRIAPRRFASPPLALPSTLQPLACLRRTASASTLRVFAGRSLLDLAPGALDRKASRPREFTPTVRHSLSASTMCPTRQVIVAIADDDCVKLADNTSPSCSNPTVAASARVIAVAARLLAALPALHAVLPVPPCLFVHDDRRDARCHPPEPTLVVCDPRPPRLPHDRPATAPSLALFPPQFRLGPDRLFFPLKSRLYGGAALTLTPDAPMVPFPLMPAFA